MREYETAILQNDPLYARYPAEYVEGAVSIGVFMHNRPIDNGPLRFNVLDPKKSEQCPQFNRQLAEYYKTGRIYQDYCTRPDEAPIFGLRLYLLGKAASVFDEMFPSRVFRYLEANWKNDWAVFELTPMMQYSTEHTSLLRCAVDMYYHMNSGVVRAPRRTISNIANEVGDILSEPGTPRAPGNNFEDDDEDQEMFAPHETPTYTPANFEDSE